MITEERKTQAGQLARLERAIASAHSQLPHAVNTASGCPLSEGDLTRYFAVLLGEKDPGSPSPKASGPAAKLVQLWQSKATPVVWHGQNGHNLACLLAVFIAAKHGSKDAASAMAPVILPTGRVTISHSGHPLWGDGLGKLFRHLGAGKRQSKGMGALNQVLPTIWADLPKGLVQYCKALIKGINEA